MIRQVPSWKHIKELPEDEIAAFVLSQMNKLTLKELKAVIGNAAQVAIYNRDEHTARTLLRQLMTYDVEGRE